MGLQPVSTSSGKSDSFVCSIIKLFLWAQSQVCVRARALVRAIIPGLSDGAARTEWGSFLGRGWGQPPPGSSPSAAPDPRSARRTSESDPTWFQKKNSQKEEVWSARPPSSDLLEPSSSAVTQICPSGKYLLSPKVKKKKKKCQMKSLVWGRFGPDQLLPPVCAAGIRSVLGAAIHKVQEPHQHAGLWLAAQPRHSHTALRKLPPRDARVSFHSSAPSSCSRLKSFSSWASNDT